MNDLRQTPAEDGPASRARDRLAAVGAFAALVSHEVRNRLAVVRAALELLDAGLEANLSPEHRAMLLREFDAFVGDFNLGVDMLRSDFDANELLSAREVIGAAVASFQPRADRAGLALTAEYGHARDAVKADRRLLRLVLLNLLRNAQEAVAQSASPRIAVRTTDQPGRLCVEVTDNGPGMEPRRLESLWAEPAKGREGSAGLGLNLCRDALVLMHGSIAYVTPPGRPGGCFRVTVPLA